MSFSVIIPSRYTANLAQCIGSIRQSRETCRVIHVDDTDNPLVAALAGGIPMTLPGGVNAVTCVPGIKPFVFARNINLGIAAAGDDDVILLNDDTRLLTDFGFSLLATVAKENPGYGIISAGITDAVGNPEQIWQPGTRLREARHHTIVFVCVYIRREVLDLLGYHGAEGRIHWLDERYESYGYDDDDLCERVRTLARLKLGVFDGCMVEHGVLPSTYRRSGVAGVDDLTPNRKRFVEKWGFLPGQGPSMKPKETPAPAPKFG